MKNKRKADVIDIDDDDTMEPPKKQAKTKQVLTESDLLNQLAATPTPHIPAHPISVSSPITVESQPTNSSKNNLFFDINLLLAEMNEFNSLQRQCIQTLEKLVKK